ncbi:MAG: ABC transporter ATP-binding protein [Clostridia bacterium]|nr:ABC transporter ATP-binding protein [Clostridia bacterium]
MLENIDRSVLRIESLTKRYGDHVAVDNLSLSISEGEICAFIGHNGAGKTTTLKCAIGILAPDEGDVYIDGISISEDPLLAKARGAYIPDNPDLYEFLSGIKYLNFIADVYGVDTEVRNAKINDYAERLGLTEALATQISSYSHGMKQKLAVISAFLHSPKLIMMDEPFVGLDPVASHTLKTMMREHCEAGGSIFFSTHVLDVAEKLCDRVAIIKEGKLVVTGSMDDVRGDASLEDVFLELQESDENAF